MGEPRRVYSDSTVAEALYAMAGVWHEADTFRVRLTGDLFHVAGGFGHEAVVRGEVAWERLTGLLDAAHHRADSVLISFPPAQWLWYLRRLDGIFQFNTSPTTEPYCHALAEALARLSPQGPLEPSQGQLRYPCGPADMRRVLELRTIVGLMYTLHSSLRWAGKGSPIRFSSTDLVVPDPSAELARAVSLHDERTSAARMGPLGPLGLGESVGLTPDIDPATGTNLPFIIPLPARQEIPLFPPNALKAGAVNGRYVLGLLDLRKIGPIADDRLPLNLRWPPYAVSAAALLYCCYHPWFMKIGQVNASIQGYYVLPREDAIDLLRWAVVALKERRLGGLLPVEAIPSRGEDVFDSLCSCPTSTWPPGPMTPILPVGGRLVLADLLAATRLLFHALARTGTGGGAEVNLWAEEFEHHVQRRIANTPWAPGNPAASLRGKRLSLGGRTITDVDAVATRGHTLILVQCKSAPFTAAYDRGEYGAIRNRSLDANAASEKWAQQIALIRRNPVGDNYDVSGFDVHGIVVYPFVVFVGASGATDEVLPGLRAVSSVEEFAAWCVGARP